MNLKLKKSLVSIISVSILTSFLCGVTVTAKAVEIDKNMVDTNNLGKDYYPNINEGGKTKSFSQPNKNPSHIENVVVFVEFGNNNFYDEDFIKKVDTAYNSQIPNDNVTSLKEYVESMSYGKQKVDTVWPAKDNKVIAYKPSKDISYYMKFSDGTVVNSSDKEKLGNENNLLSVANPNGYKNDVEKLERENELLTEIVSNIQNMLPKDIDLDQNDDGILDMISFIFNTNTVEQNIEHMGLLWPHMDMNYQNIMLDGLKVGLYNVLSTESKKTGVFGEEGIRNSVIVHEFLHSLGLPDLYRYNNTGNPVGIYDLMAFASFNRPQRIDSFYQREFLGWGESIPEITESTEHV
ncbi:MAG: immune inhibitor A domain-containing protein, partial [Clostridium sp.]